MKKACFLILRFVLFLLLFTVASGCLYMLFVDCTAITAGLKSSFFSFSAFAEGVVRFFPFSSILTLLLLFLSCIRHRNHSLWAAGIVIVLSVLVFVVFIPFSLRASPSGKAVSASTDRIVLTPGYFRKTSQGTFYFINIDKNYIASGVKVLPATAAANRIFEPFSFLKLELEPADTMRDVLISETIPQPAFFAFAVAVVNYLSQYASNLYNAGWLSYLSFAAIGIGLFSLWGISFFSSWPLLSALFVVNGFALILGVNYIITETALLDSFINVLIAYSGSLAALPFFVPLIINVLLLLFFSALGFLAWFLRYRRYAGADV